MFLLFMKYYENVTSNYENKRTIQSLILFPRIFRLQLQIDEIKKKTCGTT